MAELTPQSLKMLLDRLDPDELEAAGKYEELRLKLTKCLKWKGCPESKVDRLVDEIFDRVATKLAEGVEIENINAYACQVLKFVWMEYPRKNKEDGYDDEQMPVVAIDPVYPDEPDVRILCLRSCLVEVPKDDEERRLILTYYDSEAGDKDKVRRQTLAERLGIKSNALKVRMFRLRERLEKCINLCVEKRLKRVTE